MKAPALVAVLLLAVFAVLAVTSLARQSATSDEVVHLAAGYSYLQTGDFRLNPQHPPLMKALAALPLCFLDLKRVDELKGWKEDRERDFGHAFLLDNYEPMERLLFLGRLPIVAVALLLGWELFRWARALWGSTAALWVLFLFAFSPNLLAHSGVVTTDLGLAAFAVVALHALWRWSASGSRRDAAAAGVGVGLALLAKYSGVLVLGIAGLFIVAAWLEGKPARVALGAGALVALAAAALVTVGYGFPKGLANYVAGMTQINRDFDMTQPSFLWGQHSTDGFWYYYLLAQLWKTPLPVIVLFGTALVTLRARGSAERLTWMCVLAPVAAFHFAGLFYRPNIGLRHVLPALPFMLLATGEVARRAAAGPRGRVVLGALALWEIAGTMHAYPHFLAYFNELAGGPAGGVHYLGDSNLEWGQDIAGMRQRIERDRSRPVRAAVFAPLPLEAQGIKAEAMLLRDMVWPEENVDYYVGTAFLQRPEYLRDNPALRFRWLDRYRPVDTVGWSIDVFRFSTDPSARGRKDVVFLPREEWYEDARVQLQRILAYTPGFAEARRLLARVFAERSAWETGHAATGAALDDALRALAADPSADHRTLARVAIDAYASAPRAASPSGESACVLARARAATDDVAGGVRGLLDCVAEVPGDAAANARLAELYERVGLSQLALARWRELARDPANAEARAAVERLSSAEERR